MYNNIVLIQITLMLLFGVAIASIPIPLLWGMGCLTFAALAAAFRRPQRG